MGREQTAGIDGRTLSFSSERDFPRHYQEATPNVCPDELTLYLLITIRGQGSVCQMRKFVAIALVVLVGLGSFAIGMLYEQENRRVLAKSLYQTPEPSAVEDAIGDWYILGGGEVRGYNPSDNLDYLILQMEWARETHQGIVDNPGRHWAWQRAGIDHSEWVEIYDQVIEVLKGKK